MGEKIMINLQIKIHLQIDDLWIDNGDLGTMWL